VRISSDGADAAVDGKLFHAQAAAVGRQVGGTTTAAKRRRRCCRWGKFI